MEEKILKRLRENDTTLTSLDLWNTAISFTDYEPFANELMVNTTLTALDLWNNGVDSDDCEYLARALAINTTLTSMYLGGNVIGPTGCEYLTEALTVNTTLTTLNLMSNGIGPDGCEQPLGLAKALTINTTLTALDLRNNRIGSVGCRHLAKALEVNTTLITLTLGFNGINQNDLDRISRLIRRNRMISRRISLPEETDPSQQIGLDIGSLSIIVGMVGGEGNRKDFYELSLVCKLWHSLAKDSLMNKPLDFFK